MESLATRALAVWVLEAIGGGVVLGAGSFGVEMLFGFSFVKVFALIVVVLGIAYMFARYRTWTFEIEDDAVYLEHGVFSRVKMVVPLVRIQHVDSRRSPVQRATGLSSLVIYTAGSQGSDAKIPGLKPKHAERLQDELKHRTVETETEDEVEKDRKQTKDAV